MLSDIYQRCNFSGVEPENYEEAINHDVWKKAVEQEIRMIEKNNTWELVAIPRKRSCKSKMDLQNQTQSGRRYSKAQRKVGF